ncbi:MAG: hypothetical protein ACJAXJ_004353, partial [Colwellia sp.]
SSIITFILVALNPSYAYIDINKVQLNRFKKISVDGNQ